MIPEANPKRSTRPWAVMLLTLTALVALAPTSADAGCLGHAVSSADSVTVLGLDELTEADTFAGSAAKPPAQPAPTDAPPRCSGAFCSGSPAVPSPTAAVPLPTSGLWAIVGDAPETRVSTSQPFPCDDPSRLPLTRDLSIFHPPRLRAATSI
ncbi:hypothetical protein [Planctomyces sp. SH-PL62]|uniref:hypothetical protein n=1 Tax=Planctomyces sp. SH-PL62 TaxID=1636152 RepID=UPI0012E7426E|nr:hypothetical protein [Planctomyces sp. SH-PL62]